MRNLAESLFWEIFHRRETVRSELAQQFQVSAATVSRAVGVLLSKQLVVEIGAPAASRGRRPALLQLNPSLAYVGGIELDRNRSRRSLPIWEGTYSGAALPPRVPRTPSSLRCVTA
jgi:hypothetical protein